MDKSMFELMRTYSRREIYNVLGGDLNSNFPIHQGQVAYSCITKLSHPDAPKAILIAREGQMIEAAKQCASQREALPVFIKLRQQEDEWVYQGRFVAERYSDDLGEIAPYVRRAGRAGIAGVLFLQQIDP